MPNLYKVAFKQEGENTARVKKQVARADAHVRDAREAQVQLEEKLIGEAESSRSKKARTFKAADSALKEAFRDPHFVRVARGEGWRSVHRTFQQFSEGASDWAPLFPI